MTKETLSDYDNMESVIEAMVDSKEEQHFLAVQIQFFLGAMTSNSIKGTYPGIDQILRMLDFKVKEFYGVDEKC